MTTVSAAHSTLTGKAAAAGFKEAASSSVSTCSTRSYEYFVWVLCSRFFGSYLRFTTYLTVFTRLFVRIPQRCDDIKLILDTGGVVAFD